jgi:hypothetical protein
VQPEQTITAKHEDSILSFPLSETYSSRNGHPDHCQRPSTTVVFVFNPRRRQDCSHEPSPQDEGDLKMKMKKCFQSSRGARNKTIVMCLAACDSHRSKTRQDTNLPWHVQACAVAFIEDDDDDDDDVDQWHTEDSYQLLLRDNMAIIHD